MTGLNARQPPCGSSSGRQPEPATDAGSRRAASDSEISALVRPTVEADRPRTFPALRPARRHLRELATACALRRDYGDPLRRGCRSSAFPAFAAATAISTSWRFTCRPIAIARAACVCFDYRGRGRSEWDEDIDNYNPLTEMNDVLDGMAALGISRAVVVGTSRGGIIAMLMGVARPSVLAGVVLNDIGPIIEALGLARHQDLCRPDAAARTTGPTPSRILKRLHGAHFTALNDEHWLAFARMTYRDEDGLPAADYDPGLAEDTRRHRFRPPDARPCGTSSARLRAVPVLAIRGGNSDLLSRRDRGAMAAEHPALRPDHVAGEGHPPAPAPRPILHRISAFITGVEGRGPPADAILRAARRLDAAGRSTSTPRGSGKLLAHLLRQAAAVGSSPRLPALGGLDVAGLAAAREDGRLADPVVALDPFGKGDVARHPAHLGRRPRGDLAEVEDAEAVEQFLVPLADAANALEVVGHAVPRRRAGRPDASPAVGPASCRSRRSRRRLRHRGSGGVGDTGCPVPNSSGSSSQSLLLPLLVERFEDVADRSRRRLDRGQVGRFPRGLRSSAIVGPAGASGMPAAASGAGSLAAVSTGVMADQRAAKSAEARRHGVGGSHLRARDAGSRREPRKAVPSRQPTAKATSSRPQTSKKCQITARRPVFEPRRHVVDAPRILIPPAQRDANASEARRQGQ